MKILFCSDGSRHAERAVRFAAQIAAACQAESSILGVAAKAGDEEALLRALQPTRDIFEELHLDAELITAVGRPEREIAKRTMETHYDLVVIGALCKNPLSRLLDPWWISKRAYHAHKIIESVEPPVLVVFCDRPVLRRILLCTSGTAYIENAIEFAGNIARCLKAVVNLFHVMQEPPAVYADLIRLEEDVDRLLESNSKLGRSLRRQKELLEKLGVFGEIRLCHGLVVPELLKELQRNEYDLVVSGSAPAQDKLSKYLMGDVAREIVNRAELPVLVVRTVPTRPTHRFKELLGPLFRLASKTSEAPPN